MSRYVEPIVSAVMLFPLAAAVFTLPYMIYCYRKYGSILFMRVLCVYGFILYLMCTYCLAILPFPEAGAAVMQKRWINLIPFSYVPEILTRTVEFSISQPSTWIPALFSSGLYEPIFNIIMFFPLGVFLRYYFGCSRRKTVLIAFGCSLFIELTQLSATYGLAPYRYRLCDVNDLIDNTLGGFLGYLCTPVFTFILPTRERLNQVSYTRGMRVSYVRRCFSLMTDLFIIYALTAISSIILPNSFPGGILPNWLLSPDALYIFWALLLAGVLPRFWQGSTPGKALVKIGMVDDRTGKPAGIGQYLLRACLLYICILRPDILLSAAWPKAWNGMGCLAVSLVTTGLAFLSAVWHGIRNRAQMRYEIWTHIRQVSHVRPSAEAGKDAAAS